MSTPKTPSEPDVPAVKAETIALDDWCQGKSRALGRRVEALSAFYRLAQAQGKGRATAEQFDADFAAFLKQPA